MKKLKITTCFKFVLSMAILLSFVTNANAEGFNEKLKGTYAFSTIVTCSGSGGNTSTNHVQGELLFNGDGTGESSLIALVINHNPAITGGDPPDVKQLSGNFTYSVGSDDYFTFDSTGLSVVGTPVIISGIAQEGRLGHGAQTLLIADTDTNTETISIGGNVIRTRTCGRSGTAVKIHSN